WSGAHVRVGGDGGVLYRLWQGLGAQPRVSSHYPNVHATQYELPLGIHAFLFGLDEKGDTWFQAERHPFISWWKDRKEDLEHLVDYAEYRLTGDNVGPFGLSPHTESHAPLVVPFQRPTTSPAPSSRMRRHERVGAPLETVDRGEQDARTPGGAHPP